MLLDSRSINSGFTMKFYSVPSLSLGDMEDSGMSFEEFRESRIEELLRQVRKNGIRCGILELVTGRTIAFFLAGDHNSCPMISFVNKDDKESIKMAMDFLYAH